MCKISFTTFIFICCILIISYTMVQSELSVIDDKMDDNKKMNSGKNNINGGSKRNLRSVYGFGPRMLQISRSKIPIELDLLVNDDDALEKTKRFDDYGHLRFGKRTGEDQFDDYGHMRFGRGF